MNGNGAICGQPDSFAFTADNAERAKAILARYPQDRRGSAMMPLLTLAQEQSGGWLPKAAMDYIADHLGVPRIRAYEVATFYTMYNLAPVGRHHVQVCTNISCWLRGSDEVLEACKRFLGIEPGQTTPDGAFTLAEVECLGACANGPVMQVGVDYYEDLDATRAEALLVAFRAGHAPVPGPQGGRKGCEPADGPTSLTFEDGAEASGNETGAA